MLILRTPTFISDSKVHYYGDPAHTRYNFKILDGKALYKNVQSVARTENEKILATNASFEAPLERQKMIILFMKIRLISLQSRAICK